MNELAKKKAWRGIFFIVNYIQLKDVQFNIAPNTLIQQQNMQTILLVLQFFLIL